jgi:hypothetical protein
MHTRGHSRLTLLGVACAGIMAGAQAVPDQLNAPALGPIMTPAAAQVTTTTGNNDKAPLPGTIITAPSPHFDRGLASANP